MTVIFGGTTALSLYLEHRFASRYSHISPDSHGSYSRKELLQLLEQPEFCSMNNIQVLLPKKSKGRKSLERKLEGTAAQTITFKSVDFGFYGNSFVDCGDYCLVSPELCFLQMAQMEDQIPMLDLILLGYKMCGDYRPSEQRFLTGDIPLTSVGKLEDFLSLHAGFRGVERAKRACSYLLDNSNSHMETRLALALSPRKGIGALGLSSPALNQEIPGTAGRKGDLCWLDKGLVVEYDSKENHEEEEKLDKDALRAVQIGLTSVQVVTLRKLQVMNADYLKQTAQYLAKVLGESIDTRAKDHDAKYEKLHRQLFHRPNALDEGCN